MIEATDANFSEVTAEGYALVKFGSKTCGPCKTIGMILANMKRELDERGISVVDVDIEECPETAVTFDISTVPQVSIIKDGAYVGGFVGMRTKKQIMKVIEDALR